MVSFAIAQDDMGLRLWDYAQSIKKNRPRNFEFQSKRTVPKIGGYMRIDKYLKNARIIKRRTIAKEACEQGRVLVNGKTAKPGTEIEIGDEIEIIFGIKPMKIKVEKLLEHVVKDDYKEMYSIINV